MLDLRHDEASQAAEDLAQQNSSKRARRSTVLHRKAEPISADGGEKIDAIGITCDVSSEESVQAAFATIKQRFGRLDAVVASAGIVENYSALEQVAHFIYSPSVFIDWRQILGTPLIECASSWTSMYMGPFLQPVRLRRL